jgi:D-xylose transport system substrate-binding protein
MLKLGQLNVLQPLVTKGDIEIVYDSFVEEWTADEGYRLMKECLNENKEIDAVLASNDALAEGALVALKESGVEELPYITGQDAGIDACRRVISGEQTITVYKPIEAIASKTAEFAMQIAKTGEVPKTYLSVNNGARQIPSVLLPAMVVNKETISLTVVADGYLEENNIRMPAENNKQ